MNNRLHPISWLAKAFEPSPLLGSLSAITVGVVLLVNLMAWTFTGHDSLLHISPQNLNTFMVLGNIPTFFLFLLAAFRKSENRGVDFAMLLLAAGMFWGGLGLMYLNEHGGVRTAAMLIFLSPYFIGWMVYSWIFVTSDQRGRRTTAWDMARSLAQVVGFLGGGFYFVIGMFILSVATPGYPLLDLLYFLPWVFGGICYGGLFGLIAPGLIPMGLQELWSGWKKTQVHTVMNRLEERGWATVGELCAMSWGSEELVRDAASEVGVIAISGEEDDLLWVEDHLNDRLKTLQGMVDTRGRVHLREAERKLDVPSRLVKHLVHTMAESEDFTGWVDWDNGMLVSAQAAEMGDLDSCPRCAGELRHEGQGVVACFHCGAEIFLKEAA